MEKYIYGNENAANILIQLVDDHDLEDMEIEVTAIKENAGDDFCLIALKVGDWNRDLSPWQAPAVFGNEDFGGGAADTLEVVISEVDQFKETCGTNYGADKTFYIGGYSLAGLFALWAVYQTDVFAGAAAASPSVWFPGFLDYMKTNGIRCGSVYLSLGDKEEKTRNPVMATVGDRINKAHEHLSSQGVSCTLEWNQGNHFKDAGLRTAKAFSWMINNFPG